MLRFEHARKRKRYPSGHLSWAKALRFTLIYGSISRKAAPIPHSFTRSAWSNWSKDKGKITSYIRSEVVTALESTCLKGSFHTGVFEFL